jgi:hypothetical protein
MPHPGETELSGCGNVVSAHLITAVVTSTGFPARRAYKEILALRVVFYLPSPIS